MQFELLVATDKCNIRVVGRLKQRVQVLSESTFGYFESIHRRLTTDVDAIGDHADLAIEGQLVVGQETVRFVE